jgi:hypothetical protein
METRKYEFVGEGTQQLKTRCAEFKDSEVPEMDQVMVGSGACILGCEKFISIDRVEQQVCCRSEET